MTAERHRVIADRVRRLGTETAFAVSAEAAEWAAPRTQGLSIPPRRPGPADAGERRGRGREGDRRRQDRLLPQRRHPGAARGAGRRRRRLARARARSGERRHRARRQAGDRQVHPRPHEPGRRGPLPQPGLPDLREPDRVPRRRRPALRLRRGRRELRAGLRGARAAGHAEHAPPHLQQPAEPHRRRELAGGARARGRVRAQARPHGAQRRGLLGHPLLRRQPLDRFAPRHGRAHGRSSTRSARSSR